MVFFNAPLLRFSIFRTYHPALNLFTTYLRSKNLDFNQESFDSLLLYMPICTLKKSNNLKDVESPI